MFKFCCLCSKDRLTEGGVETKRTQWMCAKCWVHFNKKKAGHKALLSSYPPIAAMASSKVSIQ